MSDPQENLTGWKKAIAGAKDHFNSMSDQTLTWERESRFAFELCKKNDRLQSCSMDSIRQSVYNVAATGLSLNPALGHAYLVPRSARRGEPPVCVLDIGYRGFIKAATSSGGLRSVYTDIVRENDTFEFRGKSVKPNHLFNPFDKKSDRGPIIGAYCVAITVDNDVLVESMTFEEIEKIRKTSPMGKANAGPWKEYYEEMAKKSVLRRASKWWPYSNETRMEAIAEVDSESADLYLASPGSEVVTEEQSLVLEAKATERELDHDTVLSAFGVQSYQQVPADKFEQFDDYLQKIEIPGT